MRELTTHEIEQINGGIGPAGSITGGVYGGLAYLGSAAVTGDFSLRGLAGHTASGAAMGFVGGPITSAAGRYLAPRVATIGGMIQGSTK